MPTKLFWLLFITPLVSIAQPNYKESLLVTGTGDTLKGFINYREWHQNPAEVSFKQSLNDDNVRIFTPDNISWFEITGFVSYTSYTVSISMDGIDFASLKEVPDTTRVIKTVFLKEVLRGDRVNLYYYKDKIKERFYIVSPRQTTPQELRYHKTLKDMQEQTNEMFKQQLAALAISEGILTQDLHHDIEMADYSSEKLKKLLGRFNSMAEEGFTRIIDQKRSVNFLAGIGVSYYKLKYGGENLITVDRIDNAGMDKFKDQVTTKSVFPRFSAGVDFYINPAIRRLVIRMEVSASKLKSTTKSYYKYNDFTEAENENTYTLSAWNFSITPQCIFNFYNTENFKAYAGAGGAFNYIRVGDNTLEKRPLNQPGTTSKSDEDYLSFKNTNLNAVVRLGLQLRQSIDFSFIWSNPTEYTSTGTGRQSLRAGLMGICAAYYLTK